MAVSSVDGKAVDRTLTEVPPTLEEAPPPRLLGLWDQTVLWGNLGISILLLPVGAALVDAKTGCGPSLLAAMAAIAVGGVSGNAMLGLPAGPGGAAGAPPRRRTRGL